MALSRSRLGQILSSLVVLLVAVPATAHAVHERASQRRAEAELARMTESIGQLRAVARGAKRVSVNGAAVLFDESTKDKPLDEVMAGVAAECASGDRSVALADPTPSAQDGPSRPTIELERMAVAEAETGERASLCIFKAEASRPTDDEVSAPGRRVRYTLARAIDARTTLVVTVVNASTAPLAEMFPADRDAPWSDLPDVARPEGSRRSLTAILNEGDDSVRIYESPLAVVPAIASYDAAMHVLGFAITGSLPEARMYRKDGRSFAVSFAGGAAGSLVTIVPFDEATRARRPASPAL